MFLILNFVFFAFFVVKFLPNLDCGYAGLIPHPFWQGQAGEVFSGKTRIRLDAEALEDGDQLPNMLRGVPSGALE